MSSYIFHFGEMFWDYFIIECEKAGKKPSQVMVETGSPVGSMTAWKKGTEPNTKALLKIADYFDVSIDYLLGRSDPDQVMPEEEQRLLKNYRRADERGREMIQKIAEAEAKRGE